MPTRRLPILNPGPPDPEPPRDDVPPPPLERDAADHPALYPFGTELVDFLPAEAEAGAPFEARLRSVWRYVVGRIKRFAATLTPREAAVLDVEDISHMVVAQLIEKDPYWDPGRGKYTTFAESILLNVLSTCHEQARAVSGPANSYARLRGYYARRAEGTLTRGMWHTMSAIERVMADVTSLADEARSETEARDRRDRNVTALIESLRSLEDPIQVWVLVRKYGLFGARPLTCAQIAAVLHVHPHRAKALIRAAKRRIKAALETKDLLPCDFTISPSSTGNGFARSTRRMES